MPLHYRQILAVVGSAQNLPAMGALGVTADHLALLDDDDVLLLSCELDRFWAVISRPDHEQRADEGDRSGYFECLHFIPSCLLCFGDSLQLRYPAERRGSPTRRQWCLTWNGGAITGFGASVLVRRQLFVLLTAS